MGCIISFFLGWGRGMVADFFLLEGKDVYLVILFREEGILNSPDVYS